MFEKMFEKIKGSYFAFITLIAAGFGLFGSLFLYLPENPSFSMISNYISDLSGGPLSARIIWAIGIGFAGLFLMFLIIYISNNLKQKEVSKNLVWIYLITGIIGAIGLILTGVFPLDPAMYFSYEVHRIGGILFFSFSSISFFCLGYIEYKDSILSKVHSVLSLIIGLITAIFIIGFIIQEYSAVPRQPFVYLTEWLFFGVITIWLILHGLSFRKKW
jgi:hypothetical membrane protein